MRPVSASSTPREHAIRVIALTVLAWKIAPASPNGVASRAPRGHKPGLDHAVHPGRFGGVRTGACAFAASRRA